MQLDQTHVAVRVRTLPEIGDLALVIFHRYPLRLLLSFLLGAWPWMVANALLLYWIPIQEAEYGLDDSDAAREVSRYVTWMVLLVFLQTPAAGIVTTVYLGQAVFEQKPSLKSALAVARSQFMRWFYCLGIRRLAVPAMVLVAIRMFSPQDTTFDVTIPIVLSLVVIVMRASRPFLPEMIVLERCPMRSKNPNEITLRRRAKALHQPSGSDVGSRWIAVSGILVVIFAGFFYSLLWLRGIATGYWNVGLFPLIVLLPIALWVIGAVSVVVRMIAYIDTRIRLEGWDVELAVRAEAIRQFGEDLEPSFADTPTDRASTILAGNDDSQSSIRKPAAIGDAG